MFSPFYIYAHDLENFFYFSLCDRPYSELWPKDWNPCQNTQILFFFQPSWPSQTNIQNSGSTISNDHGFGGFALAQRRGLIISQYSFTNITLFREN